MKFRINGFVVLMGLISILAAQMTRDNSYYILAVALFILSITTTPGDPPSPLKYSSGV